MTISNESSAYAQAYHAHTTYLTGATGLPVQDDQDDRVDLANATHTVVANDDLDTGLNHTVVDTGRITAWVYSGGNRVTVASNRAGVDLMPEDAQKTEDLEHEVLVANALDNDALFSRGGFIAPSYTAGAYSPYLDPLWLTEASKMTGEKFF